MNAKTIVSAFALLALCFVPAASFAKAITPDYSMIGQSGQAADPGQEGSKNVQKNTVNVKSPSDVKLSEQKTTQATQGQYIGWMDDKGRVISGGDVVGNVDWDGKAYSNKTGQKIGAVMRPDQALNIKDGILKETQNGEGARFDASGQPLRTETCSKKENRQEEVCVQDFYPSHENLYDSLGAALIGEKQRMKGETESSFLVLRTKEGNLANKPGKYLVTQRARFSEAEKARSNAPANFLDDKLRNLYEVVAVAHNHPNENQKWDWFSTGDAISSKSSRVDSIVYGCATDTFLWLHVEDGRVTDLDNNIVTKPFVKINATTLVSDGQIFFAKDDNCRRAPYDPDEWSSGMCNERQVADSGECSGVHIVEGGIRGWCKCKRPQHYDVGDVCYLSNGYAILSDFKYCLCRNCGRMCKERGVADMKIVRKYDFKNWASDECYRALLKRSKEIESIPDGRIIIPGSCACKVSDPILVGEWVTSIEDMNDSIKNVDFYVCTFCGRIHPPDASYGINLGPTGWSELGYSNCTWKKDFSAKFLKWIKEAGLFIESNRR